MTSAEAASGRACWLFVLPPWRAVIPSDRLRFALSLALLPQEFGRTRDFLTRLRDAERRGTHDLVRLERGEWSLAVVAR